MSATSPQPFEPGPRLVDGSALNSALANPVVSNDNAETATGSTRAGAYAITARVTRFSTVAASTGALLPANVQAGSHFTVFNDGASTLQVYGSGSDTIDGVAGATGVPLSTTKRCVYFCLAAGVWISAQLGVVSA